MTTTLPAAGARAGNPAPGEASQGHGQDEEREREAAIVAAALAGDGEAFAGLVAATADRVHALMWQLTGGDRQLAEEFVQEAFARAWERLASFRGECRFFTWLYRLARNRAIDLLRRQRARPLVGEELERLAGATAEAPAVASDDLRQVVRAAVQALPSDQRELLLLRDFEGLGMSELATLLECPIGTVKSRLHRARAALRAGLAGRLGPEDLA